MTGFKAKKCWLYYAEMQGQAFMDSLRFIPWLIGVILVATLLLGGYEYLSILQSTNGRSSSHRWITGRWFIIALVGLVFIAFTALFLVSLTSP
jgi:hypothetical protein